jgi:hypothetical protein
MCTYVSPAAGVGSHVCAGYLLISQHTHSMFSLAASSPFPQMVVARHVWRFLYWHVTYAVINNLMICLYIDPPAGGGGGHSCVAGPPAFSSLATASTTTLHTPT